MKTNKIIAILSFLFIFAACSPTLENGAKIVKDELNQDVIKIPSPPTGLVISTLNVSQSDLWITYKDTINKSSDPIKIRYYKAGTPFGRSVSYYEIQLP